MNLSSSQPAGVAQLVEFQPSKLAVEGSNPFSRSNETDRSPISTDERNLDFMGVATQTKRHK